ncbi:MAG: hypothetical protein K9J37_11785 [Saprospiraceae bacterium]|nr:hypothetical protein [Saprospiraceae bacterium]MCF8250588.1 hypothetical protein [Saprospiraceae bacterium]MCF8281404.1 hypothetical protein [Bacteroidales bacterium]MCF8313093.1 hypothetical protein [Saprospiraceae bacterium]MCF8441543.1 hypothetical protein [Saprospiraceae bacterium]
MMKRWLNAVFIFCFATSALHFCACSGGLGGNKQHSTPALDSLLADTSLMGEEAIAPANEAEESAPLNTKPAKITMQNDLDYSADFLKKLTYAGLAEQIELADSFLILAQKDTFIFPKYLPKGNWTNFVASKGGYLYSLDVSMASYTTLDFNFELRKSRQTIDQLRGKADLNPGFVLAAETDEDPVTGSEYVSSVYEFESPDCVFNIRLGDDEGVKKVKLYKKCTTGKYNINLDDCPILLEK